MTEQEIKEGRCIIADFVDLPESTIVPEYDKDWNSLMPVWVKINSIRGVVSEIRGTGAGIYYLGKRITWETDIDLTKAVFQAVVQFINWYKNNK